MKTYFINLDVCGRDESTVTVECNNIQQEGFYTAIIDGAKLTFEYPIKNIEAE